MTEPGPDRSTEPARIGPYRLARRLGQGGMGEVFLAWDDRLGRRVAVKRIRNAEPTGTDRERLRREARAAARLNHPAVVQIYDLVESESGDALVLEFVEGRTLRDVLADGLPAPALALRLAGEIAEGLAAAHEAGLVHRDLKAENILVTREGHAKILDFGIAKALAGSFCNEALTLQGAVLGTAYAMSPEQARGGEVDARSDLFSLGVLLYELLTGRSPFRGANPLDTLQRVVSHQPQPVAEVRPGLPWGLSDLVDRLLAKRPEDRPRDAAQVAAELASLAALGFEAWVDMAAGETTLDEMPAARHLSPALTLPAGQSAGMSSAVARGRKWPLLGLVALLVALTGTAGYLLRRDPPGPLRIAVPAPEVPPDAGESFGLLSSGALTAALATLASMEGLAPLDPGQTGGSSSPVETARAAAADEVVILSMERQGSEGARLSLRRLLADGRVLWAGSFPVPAGSDDRDLRLLADAVAVHLRRAYPDRELRPGIPELQVGDRDYAELLRLKERIDRGSADLQSELARLEEIVRSSPGFLEAHLQIADAARSLFTSTREAVHLERASLAAREAAKLAPGDPRPLVARFRIALAAGQPDEAAESLATLTRLIPGDPQLHALSGQLAESRGDLEQAIADLSLAVERAPSWLNLHRLAEVEARAGRIADARKHLRELLARSPGNPWGTTQLGRLELLDGDPARAEEIFLGLIQRQPHRTYYTNLGLARSLLGHHREAVEAYRQALALDPDHIAVLLNVADAELARGRGAEALQLYQRALDRLEEAETNADLSAPERMAMAQCLAHLGRARDAVELTQKTLRESGEDPQVLYSASMVYALVGDRASAIVNAELALDKGMHPRWFALPAFGPLRNDPELRTLLARQDSYTRPPGGSPSVSIRGSGKDATRSPFPSSTLTE